MPVSPSLLFISPCSPCKYEAKRNYWHFCFAQNKTENSKKKKTEQQQTHTHTNKQSQRKQNREQKKPISKKIYAKMSKHACFDRLLDGFVVILWWLFDCFFYCCFFFGFRQAGDSLQNVCYCFWVLFVFVYLLPIININQFVYSENEIFFASSADFNGHKFKRKNASSIGIIHFLCGAGRTRKEGMIDLKIIWCKLSSIK